MTEPKPERRRASGRSVIATIFRLLVLVLIAVPVTIGLFAFAWPLEAEREWIRAQRFWRHTLADFNIALPGTPDLSDLNGRLASHGLAVGNPIFMRIFKREFELELWMMRDGRFHRFATYPICKWSGELGPKIKTGDRQAPEGFYTVDSKALNPNSSWHRSFNLGFPNAFDQAHKRTGSFLMVHGGCGSIGCYAMTNPVIDEMWSLVTAALRGGQQRFQVQVFPFRLTEHNLSRHANSPQAAFWSGLKPGYDLFEARHVPPKVSACGTKYAFAPGAEGSDGSTPVEASCPATP
ncbi:murein L,D-transpeptidase family protein [Hyphomicrobium sp.]|uniref:murein L,D-transpeptidase family protein n=1 Tax=Hyphomicrobium sp. TaxID=82 RepID=UPI002E3240D2|nr:murein L,D-transpeptidase family protein [Hyphomicrobium sp.]HEX2840947.1 murein L,D-transpeptidase family protein [Hyphomicrobium sp.]